MKADTTSSPRLAGKVALVTGASKGIGQAIALGCAREGADVIVNYQGDHAGAETTAREIDALGRRSLVVRADIGKVAQIRRMFTQARRHFPRLDVLINNAGITGWTPVWDTTEDAWDRVLDTNLKGTFFCSLEAARWMRETKTAGRIVNVSTNCAELGVKNLVAYATSKAGIHGMTKQLAMEFAPDGIRVNTFAPGPVRVSRNLKDDPDYEKSWGGVIPLGRTAAVEEMIGPALFLASDESSYVTGQTFFVDGGWTVQGKIPAANMEKAARRNR